MSFMNPVDMVEEDAADLQFPKVETPTAPSNSGNLFIVARTSADTKYIICTTKPKQFSQLAALEESLENCETACETEVLCTTCKVRLSEPYIQCNDCIAQLCQTCFASGRETAQHFNNHAYVIVRDDIQIFPNVGNWKAREERILLKTLQTQGYGNWSAVACSLNWSRSKEECRQHYHNCYFGGIFERLLGLQHERNAYFPQNLPYIAKLLTVDPPRTDDITAMQFKLMAGYRCARGDFDIPFDPSAETLLTTINEQEELNEYYDNNDINNSYIAVIDNLKCALVQAYNHRLKKRQRRYKILRDHGLIVSNRTMAWISKYTEAFSSETKCSRFLRFMQICKPIEFDLLIESLNLFAELRQNIFRLYETRQNGVKSLYGASLYFKLKKKRLQMQRENSRQQHEWRKLLPTAQGSNNMQHINPFLLLQNLAAGGHRRKPPPMDIIGLLGYAKLNDNERKLCSVERIAPEAYLDYKAILIAENSKSGFLRLADARRLIKIDVNKTRKIFDFLTESGHINNAA